MKNENYDVDKLLRRALSSTEEVDPSLIQKVKYELIKEESVLQKTKIIKSSFSRIAIAVICLIVMLPTGVIAANLLGLKGTVLPNEIDYADESRSDTISLQGYVDSNEYKALTEWLEYTKSYDQDHSILDKIGNSDTGLDMMYVYYGAYTQEMVDKIDEIVEKYDLSLHGNMTTFDTTEAFMESVAYGDFIGETNTIYPGYMYEDGTFRFEGDIDNNETFEGTVVEYDSTSGNLEDYYKSGDFSDGEVVIFIPAGGSNEDAVVADISSGELTFVPYDGDFDIRGYSPTGFQFSYCKNGSFDYVSLNIGNIDDYTEWSYETAGGITVNLAQSTSKSLIIVELDNAFVTVNVLEGSDGFSVSELEAFADSIDFTLLK